MKGFVLFLVVVLLAYTYAAPHNYGNVTGGSESFVTGELSNSHVERDSSPKPGNSLPKGNDAFSPGDAQRILLEKLAKLAGTDVEKLKKELFQ